MSIEDDILTIRNVAGDLDEGLIHSTGRRRGNIGGVVTRACDRIEAALKVPDQPVECEQLYDRWWESVGFDYDYDSPYKPWEAGWNAAMSLKRESGDVDIIEYAKNQILYAYDAGFYRGFNHLPSETNEDILAKVRAAKLRHMPEEQGRRG